MQDCGQSKGLKQAVLKPFKDCKSKTICKAHTPFCVFFCKTANKLKTKTKDLACRKKRPCFVAQIIDKGEKGCYIC